MKRKKLKDGKSVRQRQKKKISKIKEKNRITYSRYDLQKIMDRVLEYLK
jgi:hypothetical protein